MAQHCTGIDWHHEKAFEDCRPVSAIEITVFESGVLFLKSYNSTHVSAVTRWNRDDMVLIGIRRDRSVFSKAVEIDFIPGDPAVPAVAMLASSFLI